MKDLSTIRALLRYSDWANGQLVQTAATLRPELLDQTLDIGMGTLRRTLLHILAGESVWLARWRGERETPWPDEQERTDPAEIGRRMGDTSAVRDQFLSSMDVGSTGRMVAYRDSKGSLFSATLAEMMIQMCMHSTHHRSQAVNMIRRLGGKPPELDFMMWVRRPA